MRFGITGGRDYADGAVVRRALECLPQSAVMVNGMATVADSLAYDLWVNQFGNEAEAHPADWNKHGKAAGPIRNKEMLDSGLDLLIAFPGGRGTQHMKAISFVAGVPVVQCG